MKQSLRQRIVILSKELADCTDKRQQRRLREKIQRLKEDYEPTDPTMSGDLMGGK